MHFHLPKPLHGWREFAGEVAIIVLGVLIALGAEQVVEWVRRRQKQHEMLDRLFEDARYNVAQLKAQESPAEIQRETQFAAALTSGKSCPPLGEWGALLSMNAYPQVSVSTSVYDEITGSGGLNEIASTSVRANVSYFHFILGWVQSQTDYFRSAHVRPLAPGDRRVRFRYDPASNALEVTGIDRDALCGDPEFRSRVAMSVVEHVKWDKWRSRLTDIGIATCGALGRAVGKPCTPALGPPLTPAEREIAEHGTNGHFFDSGSDQG